MGYLHIENLYANQTILAFRQCWALEKIHGMSAHITWKDSKLRLSSGGAKHAHFTALFDLDALAAKFAERCGERPMTIYGEAFGGKQQGMRATYGDELKFYAFEARGGDAWLDVPAAAALALALGLSFVPHRLIECTLAAIDRERDRPSEVAELCGMGADKLREGVVLRPPFEVMLNDGKRVIAKHKRDEFRETKAPRVVADPAKLAVLIEADAVAVEWVTPMRLSHVCDHVLTGAAPTMDRTAAIITAMVEDVMREGAVEIVDTREVRKAIGAATARLYAAHVKRMALGCGG